MAGDSAIDNSNTQEFFNIGLSLAFGAWIGGPQRINKFYTARRQREELKNCSTSAQGDFGRASSGGDNSRGVGARCRTLPPFGKVLIASYLIAGSCRKSKHPHVNAALAGVNQGTAVKRRSCANRTVNGAKF
jgi:hypothetical protein